MEKITFAKWINYLVIILIISCIIFIIPLCFNIFFEIDILKGNFLPELFAVSYFVMLISGFIFWVTMIFHSISERKWFWFILILITGFLFGLIYYFKNKKKKPKEKKNV